jgi:hypothetical protein
LSDTFSDFPVTPSSPPDDGFSITPSDDTDLTIATRGIYVGVSGDLKVITLKGTTLTFVGLAAGIIHPLRVKRVVSTGTSATDIIGVV